MPPKRRVIERKAKDSSSDQDDSEPEDQATEVKIEVKEEPPTETSPDRVGIEDSEGSGGGGGGIISSEEEDDAAVVLKENIFSLVNVSKLTQPMTSTLEL